MNVPGDSRTFFHHPGANALLDSQAIRIDELAGRGMKVLYLGYLTLLDRLDWRLPDGKTAAAHVLADARMRGLTTCVDLASARTSHYRETVQATLPEIDFLFANELEAEQATGVALAEKPTADAMMRAARALKSGGVNRAVILHAPSQVVWCGNDAELAFTPDPVPPEAIVGVVGAGDAFAAGVIHGIHEAKPAESAITFGTRAAAACLSGYTATDGLETLTVPEIAP